MKWGNTRHVATRIPFVLVIRRMRRSLLSALYVALLALFSAHIYGQARPQTRQYVASLGLRAASPVQALVLTSSHWQPLLAPRYPLLGIRLTLARPGAPPTPTAVRVGATDMQGRALAENSTTVVLGEQAHAVDLLFAEPVESPQGLQFHLMADVPLQAVRAGEAGPGPGGQPLLYEPIYEAPKLMQGRLMLMAQAPIVCALALGVLVLGWGYAPGISLWAAFSIMAVFHSLARVPFWVLDEPAHLGNIAHIVNTGTLPLTTEMMRSEVHQAIFAQVGHLDAPYGGGQTMHEAVQGPLYYLLMAAVAKLSLALCPKWGVAFYAMRFAGACLLSIGFAALLRGVWELAAHRILTLDRRVLAAAVGSIMFSPGVFSCLAPLTNDQMAFLLGTVCFALLVHIACSGGPTRRQVVALGVASGALWVSKLTGAFMPVLCVACLLASRKGAAAALYAGVVACFAVPLHLHSYLHYHALTGMAGHLAYVRPVLNPQNLPLPFGKILRGGLLNYGYNMLCYETVFLRPWSTNICHHTALWTLAGLAAATVATLRRLRHGLSAATELLARPAMLEALVCMGLCGPLLLGGLASKRVGFLLVNARYGYVSLFCSCVACALAYERFLTRRQQAVVATAMATGMAYATCQYALALAPLY
jgi:hypothetical protein